MKKFSKVISMLIIAAMVCTLLSALTVSAVKVVSIVKLTIDAPAVGKRPDTTVELTAAASTKVIDVEWLENGDSFDGKFEKGNDYTVIITLGIRDDIDGKFTDASKINATVNGIKASVKGDSEEIVVKCTWKSKGESAQSSAGVSGKVIKKLEITGISTPVAGKKADMTFATNCDKALLQRNISWPGFWDYDNDTYGYNTEYTVDLNIVADYNNGYSFDESVYKDGNITLNGEPVKSISGDSKYVSFRYTFPKTGSFTEAYKNEKTEIKDIKLKEIYPRANKPLDVPKLANNLSDYTIESYEWKQEADFYGNYRVNTEYELKVVLAAKSKTMFSKDKYGEGKTFYASRGTATVVSYSEDKLVLNIKYPSTEKVKGERPATLIDSPYKFEGGTGTYEDPYLIATAHQLNAIRKGMDKHYKLVADIDLSTWGNWVPIGSNEAYGGPRTNEVNLAGRNVASFAGSLDGNGHVISGMTIKIDADELYMAETGNDRYYGLFAALYAKNTIAPADRANGTSKVGVRNLGMVNYNIDVRHRTIEKMYNVYAGAIAGTSEANVMSDCYTSGGSIKFNITGATTSNFPVLRVGGLVGQAHLNTFRNCYNLGSVEVVADVLTDSRAGNDITIAGICGANTKSWFYSCFNGGSISAPYYDNIDPTIYDSAAAGITAMSYAPIFPELYHSGEIVNAYIWNCYNAGTIKGEFVGGVTLYGNSDFYIDNCYNVGTLKNNPAHARDGFVPAYPIYADDMSMITEFGTDYVRRVYTDGNSISGELWTYSDKLGRKVLKNIPEDNLKIHTPVFSTGVKGKTPFSDVASGTYYEDAVLWALENKVTSGTSATTFSPLDTCTRAQVVTFLWRANGNPEPKSANNFFVDVKTDDYYYKAVLWAVENGITNGTSSTEFSPNATCTSAQVVTFLHRSKGNPKANGTSGLFAKYHDQYYGNAVAWAETSGLFEGLGKDFAPNANSPRADIVTYLFRCAK